MGPQLITDALMMALWRQGQPEQLLVLAQVSARDRRSGNVSEDFHEVLKATFDGFCGLAYTATPAVPPNAGSGDE